MQALSFKLYEQTFQSVVNLLRPHLQTTLHHENILEFTKM